METNEAISPKVLSPSFKKRKPLKIQREKLHRKESLEDSSDDDSPISSSSKTNKSSEPDSVTKTEKSKRLKNSSKSTEKDKNGQRATKAPEYAKGSKQRRRRRESSTKFEEDETLRVSDMLNTFKEDIVRLGVNEQSGWRSQLGEIEFEAEPTPEFKTVKREEVGTVSSKWKSAALLFPRAINELTFTKAEVEKKLSPLRRIYLALYKISSFASGLLAGILIWKTYNLINQEEKSIFLHHEDYFTMAEILITLLVLLTSTAFVMQIGTKKQVNPFLKIMTILAFCVPTTLLLVTHYLNVALSQRARECGNVLKIQNETLRAKVHLSYSCQSQSSYSQISHPLQISLTSIPAFISLLIYAYYHFSSSFTQET